MENFFYRGYIRNFRALCRELGIDLRPDQKETETEIIREGYKRWGRSLGNHLCGYFALSLYDEQRRETFCTRDPFGREALYYSVTDDGKFFCSCRLSDILTAEGVVKELNTDALEPYLEQGYLWGDTTFFKSVKMLLPAHYLIWNGEKITTGCYSEEKPAAEKPGTSEERAERIKNTLSEISAEDAERFPDCFGTEQLSLCISAENYFYALPWVMQGFDQPQTNPEMTAYMIALREPTRYTSRFSCLTGRDAFCSANREYPDRKLLRDFQGISQIADFYRIEILTPFCDARLTELARNASRKYSGLPEGREGTENVVLSVPVKDWMTTGIIKAEIQSGLSGSIARRFFGKEKVEELWARFIGGDSSLCLVIYRMYAFVLWYEAHFCSERTEWMVTTESTADVLFVQDYETGEILFERNADERRPIGSITKLAAALVIARHIPDPENTYITVDREMLASIRDQEAAYAGFQNYVGRRFSCSELLYGSLISSGCESVEILAGCVCGGNSRDFVAEMNDAAREAGCRNTFFYDACGLMDEGKSTAKDVALLVKEVFKIPFLKRMLSTSFYKIPLFDGMLMTTNELIDPKNTAGFCPYCVGGKTGMTSLSGACVSAVFERNGKKYISVVLNEHFTRHPCGTKMVFHTCREAVYRVFESTGRFIQISLPEHYKMLPVGSAYCLKPEVIRNTGRENVQYSFFSSDEEIAVVDSEGVVTVNGEGTVQLTVMTQTGDYDLCFLNSTAQTEAELRRFEIPRFVSREQA